MTIRFRRSGFVIFGRKGTWLIARLVGAILAHFEAATNSLCRALRSLKAVVARPATFFLLGSALVVYAANCSGAESPVEEKFETSHRGWTFLATSADSETYYYYNESLIKAPDGKEVSIWIKSIDLKEIQRVYGSKTPATPTHLLAHTATKIRVYCDEEELEFLEISEVDKGGRRSPLGDRGEKQTVIPDTIGHAFYNAACYSRQNMFTKLWKAVVKN